jgi:hypothetical protein
LERLSGWQLDVGFVAFALSGLVVVGFLGRKQLPKRSSILVSPFGCDGLSGEVGWARGNGDIY